MIQQMLMTLQIGALNKGFAAMALLMIISGGMALSLLATSGAVFMLKDLVQTREYRMKAEVGLHSCLAWAQSKIREDKSFSTENYQPYFFGQTCRVSVRNMGEESAGSKQIVISNKVNYVEVSGEYFE